MPAAPAAEPADAPDRPWMAAGLMLGSLFLLGLQDSLVRIAGPDTSLWQFQLLRASFNLVLLMLIARLLWGSGPRRPRRVWAVALRSLLLIGAMIGFFGGVPELTLTQMAAGLYTFPLFVTLLSALLLGERVGPRRIGAVAVGALGAVLILQPQSDAFRWLQLLPVSAGLCYAGVVITTRRLCRAESPVTLAFGVAIAFFVTSLTGVTALGLAPPSETVRAAIPYLATGWPVLTLATVGIAAVASVLNIACNIGLSRAYQSAESSWLAPFDYCYLIFAALWGFAIFGDVPDAAMVAGMALIAGAGAFTAWRERRVASAAGGPGPARR